MTEITIRSTSNTSAVVSDQELYVTSTTRLVLRPEIVTNPNDPDAGVRISLVHQRKGASQQWEDCPTFSLASLHSGQEVKLTLNSSTTKELYEKLAVLTQIHQELGVPDGLQRVLVLNKDEVLQSDATTIAALKLAFESSGPEALAKFIGESFPDLVKKMSLAQIQEARVQALSEFELLLADETKSENDWQQFFQSNTWIFGYGLRYQFLTTEAGQSLLGAPSYTGRGAQRGDFMMSTAGDISFTVLVEIKKPTTSLFNGIYRNGVAQLSGELVGGVSQIQVNAHTWSSETARSEANREMLQDAGIYTCEPKTLLIIGTLEQCQGDSRKRTTFETYRRNLVNPEIVTFDELLMRARYIVAHATESEDTPAMDGPETSTSSSCPF